jgi:hypothetical protein
MDFITFGISVKNTIMKLRLSLLLFCLFGIGLFSHAQARKKPAKPTVENGADAIPVTVTSTKKAHRKTTTKEKTVKFAPPRIVKDKPTPTATPAQVKKMVPSRRRRLSQMSHQCDLKYLNYICS